MLSISVECRLYYVQPTTLQRLESSISTATDVKRNIQSNLSFQNKREMKLYALNLIYQLMHFYIQQYISLKCQY
jgi:hypothetical protein